VRSSPTGSWPRCAASLPLVGARARPPSPDASPPASTPAAPAASADCSAAGPLTSDVGDHHAAIHLFRGRSIAGWPLRVRRARRPRTDAPSRQGARQRSDIGRGLRGSGHLFGGTCRRRAPASGDIAVHPWLDVGWAPHSKGEVRRPPLNLSGPCLSWVNASSRARPIRPHCTPSSAEASLARSRASTLTRDRRGAHK